MNVCVCTGMSMRASAGASKVSDLRQGPKLLPLAV